MSSVSNMQSRGKKAIEQARKEVDDENMKDSVTKLKAKLRELKDAQTVVANIEREITDLEEAISQGNA